MEGRTGPTTTSYIAIWVLLIILTWITVSISGMYLGNLSTLTALSIATIKSALILAVFMHLRYENKLFVIIFFVALITLTTIIGFTFLDTSFR
jgi:cytochrome c oxidase subunit 4